jgi:hypothetical protein
LNLDTGSITPQWNVVFDDWFATVSSPVEELPDFNSSEWSEMFGDATFSQPFDEDHVEQSESQAPPPKVTATTNRTTDLMDNHSSQLLQQRELPVKEKEPPQPLQRERCPACSAPIFDNRNQGPGQKNSRLCRCGFLICLSAGRSEE